MIGDQILPDGLGIPSTAQFLLDEVTVGFAGTSLARFAGACLRQAPGSVPQSRPPY